jgi:hypothetical protein
LTIRVILRKKSQGKDKEKNRAKIKEKTKIKSHYCYLQCLSKIKSKEIKYWERAKEPKRAEKIKTKMLLKILKINKISAAEPGEPRSQEPSKKEEPRLRAKSQELKSQDQESRAMSQEPRQGPRSDQDYE